MNLLLLTTCAAPSPVNKGDRGANFDFVAYFTGPVRAYGVVRDRGGKVTRSFVMEMEGRWEQGRGRLEETILYADGATQKRAWEIAADGPDRWIATADDVVGEAVFRRTGRAMFLDYVLQVLYRGKTIALTVDDRLYLQPEGVIINRSVLKKWGIRVGDILTTMLKPGDG